MNNKTTQRIHRVTAGITFAAVVFYLFFQINKGGPFGDVNPFGVDPYDAIGSFAIQGALLIGVLTYARALRLLEDPAQATKTRLIKRGNTFILVAIWVTLFADAIAEIASPIPSSYWGSVILVELALMFTLALTSTIALTVVFRRVRTVAPPSDLTPADAIEDLWTLVRIPAVRSKAVLPHMLVEWVERLNSDGLFSRVQWLNPRFHPWRFACTLGLLAGVATLLAAMQEGLPPNLSTGLLVAGITISGELGATLSGFAIFGGYLGLRPTFNPNHV